VRRRTFLVGIVAAHAPMAANAQQPSGMRRVGALMGGTVANDPEGQAELAALVEGIGELNWHEGGNLHIDWRWPGSDPTLFGRYAAELVALGPDVLIVRGSPALEAVRRQTRTMPIVFTNVADPVGQGFVDSLARPGVNITGFSSYDPPMASKWLGMLTQITPPVASATVLYDPATSTYADLMLRTIQEAAPSFAVAVQAAPCRDDTEIEAAIESLAREKRGGLLILPGGFTIAHRDAIVAAAARNRLPAIYPYRLFAAAGGLMSYGTDLIDPARRVAVYVDRILRGAKPAELPVQAPTKFELVLNLKTAKALGVTFPIALLATADEVIE
jgi:putative ABC transport system substrate-binding protein